MRAAGKVVVVTGAAGGQGAAEAAALAREGATVIGLDVQEPRAPIDGVRYRTFDVADEAHWDELRGWLERDFGAVHGLVNNAAITSRTPLGQVTVDELDRVLAVNLTGPLLAIQTLAPLMTEGGSIVNVASIAAQTGHFPPAYTASKWGAARALARGQHGARPPRHPRQHDPARRHRHADGRRRAGGVHAPGRRTRSRSAAAGRRRTSRRWSSS